jgi:AcrR family transcriptional regulator
VRKGEILDTAAQVFATSGLRASLQEIADASGILPGSLYHHFESKEDILFELVRRYQAELDRIADEAMDRGRAGAGSPLARIVTLGRAIAHCAIRHRAALLLTFYEPPPGSSDALQRLARRTPTAITAAMCAMLRDALRNGDVRADVDLRILADRLCQSMLHVGIGVYHRSRGSEHRPEVECRMLLHGLAARRLGDSHLDESDASRFADEAIKSWSEDDRDGGGKAAVIRAAARSEFARRGYELTTIRHVAAAAGLSTGTVYRLIDSKLELLGSIMASYADAVTDGWTRIMNAASTPVEKLDALLWFNINVTDRFADEQRIQMAGLQSFPLTTTDLPMTFQTQLRLLKALLSDGLQTNAFTLDGVSIALGSRCLFALVFTPENIVRDAGARGALQAARDTLLRGAAVRS